jgi:hypothetical protein
MLSKLKDQAKKVAESKHVLGVKDKSADILEQQVPKVKSLLFEKLGPTIEDALKDDELMREVLGEIHVLITLEHPALRFLIRRERFIEFCLKNRDRLIDRYDSKGLIAAAQPEPDDHRLLSAAPTSQPKAGGDI